MALSITYNTGRSNVTHVFRAINGGVDFSANLVGTAFDYFLDAPDVGDAIYFGITSPYTAQAGLEIDPAVAMAGTDIEVIWEYYSHYGGAQWYEIPRLTDNTNGLTITGANLMVFFPYPPICHPITIGGAWGFWVRCRLVSFTAVVEGGANTNDIPQMGCGKIYVNEYTVGAPATLETIYTYMNTTHPTVGMTKFGENLLWGEYQLAHATIGASDGYWRMLNNVFKVGNGSSYIDIDIKKLTDGTKVGAAHATNGSTIIYAFFNTGLCFSSSSETKLYGTTVRAGWHYETLGGILRNRGGGGYFGPQYGEYVGVMVYNLSTGYWGAGLTMKNVFIHTYFTVTYPFKEGMILENVHMYYHIDPGTAMLGLYSAIGVPDELVGLNWYIPGGYLFCAYGISAVGGPYNFNFLNPLPAFPDIGDTPDYFKDGFRDYDKDWHIYERYTFDLTVIDGNGVPVEGVAVMAEDTYGTEAFSVATNASGQIAQQKLLKSHGYYDGILKKDEYNPYTVTLSKAGFITRTIMYVMDRAREEIEVLLSKSIKKTIEGELFMEINGAGDLLRIAA